MVIRNFFGGLWHETEEIHALIQITTRNETQLVEKVFIDFEFDPRSQVPLGLQIHRTCGTSTPLRRGTKSDRNHANIVLRPQKVRAHK